MGCIAGEVLTATDAATAVAQGKARPPDLVVVREEIGVSGVLATLQAVAASLPAVPSVVVTDSPSAESALKFTRQGADDYLEAPLEGDRLDSLLAAAKRSRLLRDQAERFFCPYCPPGVPMVGRSQGITRALELLQLISSSNCNPVLILGETGTGKELAARGVHTLRCREEDRFVAINCAALTASLLESELFGHVKGAFTGADRDKTGLFEAAGHGTIFLDEISEMPADLQAKLLRVLQERSFRKVGGTTDIPCHATVIASSNRDLLKEMSDGRFRKDLYYRLAVFPVTIPPLRSDERRSDIPLLAEYLIRTSTIPKRDTVKGLSPPARKRLLQHDWPGNVRELRNVIDRALILEKTDRIQPSSIIIEPRPDADAEHAEPASPDEFSLEAAEREFIIRALKETGWQRTRAAALLGITRATLYAKLKRYGIEAPGREPSADEPPLSKASGD
ncbi:MAG: hypothetical protein AMJ81_02420 [Phycisphaerae bacterium SM23_33]|nr:MAG: hypothetical protein AMJ81_02420 [Phycisphaerae bacterium SM23_33]